MKLRIATCRPLPEPDVDEGLLLEALQAAGVDAQMAAWHESAEWRDPVPTVIRSTWDYIHHPQAFGHWLHAVAATAPLWNPLDVLLGNLRKRYLIELAEHGVPVTPTVLERGKPADLRTLCAGRGWQDVVVKPAVGAGSHETHRLNPATGRRRATRGAPAGDAGPAGAALPVVGRRLRRARHGLDRRRVRTRRTQVATLCGRCKSVSESLPISPKNVRSARRHWRRWRTPTCCMPESMSLRGPMAIPW
jgi:hypothetical protein